MNDTSLSNEQAFEHVCDIIEMHRSRALYAVNQEHLLTCWEVGVFVSARLRNGQWGDSVVCALADYIKRTRPELKGYSKSNLYNMVKFYQEYSSVSFQEQISSHPALMGLQSVGSFQPMAGKIGTTEFFQPMAGKIDIQVQRMPAVLQLVTYTHHTIILNNCQDTRERLFYILYANHERLNKRQLERVIASDTYKNLLGGDKSNMLEWS